MVTLVCCLFTQSSPLADHRQPDFNLSFYTEVQDLSYLTNSLERSSPRRYAALNMALISLIEDYSLVGFETLAVEDKASMMHLTRTIDRVVGYVFVPPSNAPLPPEASGKQHELPPSARPNMFGLFTTAASSVGAYDARDVQERWVDSKEVYDEWEKQQWKKEAQAVR